MKFDKLEIRYLRRVRTPYYLAGMVGDVKRLPLRYALQLVSEGFAEEVQATVGAEAPADEKEKNDGQEGKKKRPKARVRQGVRRRAGASRGPESGGV